MKLISNVFFPPFYLCNVVCCVDYLWYRRKVEGANPDSLGFDVIDEWGRWSLTQIGGLPLEVEKGSLKVLSKNPSDVKLEHASSPPRGWNSYDSFSWTISEEEKVEGANADSLGFDVIDEWGRVVPDPDRWPSSRDGKGFTEVAKKVHDMGLKFGIHVMRGISTQAVNANTPILDLTTGKAYEAGQRNWTSQDIGLKKRTCSWMQNGFMSVDTTLGAGNAFLRSLYTQYAEWGILKQLDQPILYSLSPGTGVTPKLAKAVSGFANMYRITADDWDSWGDVASHFDVSRDLAAANLIGADGLLGKSWPDLDMLPLGWLTDPAANEGPHRASNLTADEQRTQITLWSMAKSPLMFGGDVRNLDNATYDLITNAVLLEINSFSSGNMEACFPYITNGTRSWIATGRNGEIYLAFFNVNTDQTVITAMASDLAKVLPSKNLNSCKGNELWSGKDFGVLNQSLSTVVEGHGCALFILNCS
ncbi:alpha-galactosidase [Quercus suber]|uniref:alpha-galactosidase n=1 Tax=Quercus suber TaxID=58331 RepID=A0AAW0LI86_QUESU